MASNASATTLSGVIVVGTDTEVGKTYQACQLAANLSARGQRVGVYKPVASGLAAEGFSDAELLRAAADCREPLERICPQQFRAPLAPPVAAQLESRSVDEHLLLAGARWWQGRCDFLIVEGAGGALSPISDSLNVLHVATQLQLPLVVVAANRLGVINHTLLTLEAADRRNLQVAGIVLNDLPLSADAQLASRLARESNAALLRAHVAPQIPIATTILALVPSLLPAANSGHPPEAS